ncbi:PTS ascorbate transporter subunit IIC [Lachnospiraceae bacterium 47-T17]
MADGSKKQVPLRLSAKLYNAIAAWAEDDFRSVNGQIEYLLTECVRQRKKNGRPVPHNLDEPPELDIK